MGPEERLNRPIGKSSPVSKQIMSLLDTFPALCAKIRTTSCSEQKCSREEWDKGTIEYLPAKAADISLSLKDGSDPLKVGCPQCPPQISIDGEVTWTFKKITSDQNNQGLNSEGANTKDTIKTDEPIAQRTRCRFKLQRPVQAPAYG